ncbi:hypothetical protein OTU49_011205 [Cherax quadricarinatus]|uniref:Uncharacterized protein n=3 Tax=Cherax quadricarinatus TaxID=27406 RepID=A0AAW0W5Y6_CHEQU
MWRNSSLKLSTLVCLCLLTIIFASMNKLFPDVLGFVKPQFLRDAPSSKDSRCQLKLQLDPCKCSRTIHWYSPYCPSQVIRSNTSIKDKIDIVVDEWQKQSTCGTWATLRGPAQKVVSYSLYGKFPSEYHSGLEQLAPLVVKMYPEWVMRIYLDLSLKQQREWACNLACNNQHIDLCDTGNISGVGDVRQSSGTSWRFCVVGDPLVERYIVRDADSPILQREVDAVDDWISSGKCFHVMRDNAHHGVSMVAGTWGGCNTWQASKATPIRDSMLKSSLAWNQDQPVLWAYMWPWAIMNVTIHDSYTCLRFPGSLPFPTQRYNDTFIGMRSYREEFKNDGVRSECPMECRPAQHKDWKYC